MCWICDSGPHTRLGARLSKERCWRAIFEVGKGKEAARHRGRCKELFLITSQQKPGSLIFQPIWLEGHTHRFTHPTQSNNQWLHILLYSCSAHLHKICVLIINIYTSPCLFNLIQEVMPDYFAYLASRTASWWTSTMGKAAAYLDWI